MGCEGIDDAQAVEKAGPSIGSRVARKQGSAHKLTHDDVVCRFCWCVTEQELVVSGVG
jgi:hypothetical protein